MGNRVIIFLRHPTLSVKPGMCYGRLELETHCDANKEIAKAIMLTPTATLIRASPSKRCYDLAKAISERDNIDIIFDERLLELNFGKWEGVMWKDLDRKVTEDWLSDLWNKSPPNGETFTDLYKRMQSAIKESSTDSIFVCHSGPIRAAMMIIQGKTFQEAFSHNIAHAIPYIIA